MLSEQETAVVRKSLQLNIVHVPGEIQDVFSNISFTAKESLPEKLLTEF